MNLSQEKSGEAFIIWHCLISSIFPVVTKALLSGLGPLPSLAWSMLLASSFFALLVSLKRSQAYIFDRSALKDVMGAALILSLLFPLLQFVGIQYTSPGNAAVILTLEVLFTYLFFNVWKKENLDKKHTFGALLMFISAIIILFPNFTEFHKGDLIILFAIMLPPLGNLFQKRARQKISSEGILLLRTLVAIPMLFGLAYLWDGQIEMPSSLKLWFLILINGCLYLGFAKILWIEGIHRISITKSSALVTITPAFTLLFAYLFLGQLPAAAQIWAVPPSMIGIYLLTRPVNLDRELLNF